MDDLDVATDVAAAGVLEYLVMDRDPPASWQEQQPLGRLFRASIEQRGPELDRRQASGLVRADAYELRQMQAAAASYGS